MTRRCACGTPLRFDQAQCEGCRLAAFIDRVNAHYAEIDFAALRQRIKARFPDYDTMGEQEPR